MKVTFIGTSHGVPAPDRYCSCTMLEVGGAVYFIDGGTSIADAILRHDKHPNDIRAVFTTHSHGDHINGILPLADLVSWYYKEASVDIYMTQQDIIDAMTRLIEISIGAPLASGRVRFKLVNADFVYEDENIRVSLVPTRHMEYAGRPAYSIVVEAEGKKLLFTGDMSQWLKKEDFPKIASEQDFDVVVSEMAHFTPEQVTPYMETCRTKEFWFTHVFPLEKFEAIEAMDGKYPYPVKIAHDEDEIIF